MIFLLEEKVVRAKNVSFGGNVGLIPDGYICVLQRFDVGVIRSSKAGIWQFFMVWAAKRMLVFAERCAVFCQSEKIVLVKSTKFRSISTLVFCVLLLSVLAILFQCRLSWNSLSIYVFLCHKQYNNNCIDDDEAVDFAWRKVHCHWNILSYTVK